MHQARQQIGQLKGMMHDNGVLNAQPASAGSTLALVVESAPNKERAQAPRAMPNFFKVRRNIRNYGRGIFKPPQAYRTPGIQLLYQDANTPLPPKHQVDMLLAQYRAVLHPNSPVLHWPTFQSECDNLYRVGSFQGLRKIWISVFFATLACASLVLDSASGVEINTTGWVEMAMRNSNTMSDEVSIDHARTMMLLSMYFMELNLRSAGWIWLSAAVRTAQESGLHCDPGPTTPLNAELRRRVWWSIYNYDR